MAKSSIEIRNDIKSIEDRMSQCEQKFNDSATDADLKAALRDEISECKGRVAALNEVLDDTLAAEDKMRAEGGYPLVASAPERKVFDVARAFLGTRDEFARKGGLHVGDKRTFSVSDTADTTHQYGLPTPERVSYDLPSNIIEMPMGVLDTLPKGTTDSNMTYYVPGEFTNNAAHWVPGETKAESDEYWSTDSADLFVTAHHMPVSRQTANHYGQLDGIIRHDLLYGLRVKERYDCLNLDEGSNKKGILKKDGVQSYTAVSGDTLYDSVRRMKTKSWMATGYQPTHVAMHPLVVEALDLAKDENKRYMLLTLDGKMWAMPIVEDVNLFATDSETGATSYGMLVYNNMAATWYTSEENSITVGLIDQQLIKNEYTILAEGEHLIAVTRPKSFVYMADTGVTEAA